MKTFLAETHLADSISQMEDPFHTSRLKATQNTFKHFINAAGVFIAPIHRLPEDVLVEIFLAYIATSMPKEVLEETLWNGDRPVSFVFHYRHLLYPTLHLSHICSFWRNVIFSRPSLWSSLYLDFNVLTDGRLSSKLFPVLSHYLSRSSHVPLNLHVFGSGDLASQAQAFNMLVDHCTQWQRLDLNVYPELFALFLSRLQSTDQPLILPHLKVLRLRPWTRSNANGLHSLLAHFPNLQCLHGHHLELSWEEFHECSLQKLEELHNVHLYGASIGQFLAQTPLLNVCELNTTLGLTAGMRDPFQILHLTTLSVILDGCPPETWRTLRTPNLTSLELGHYHKVDSTVEEISAMLLQSGCTLRKISLKDIAAAHAIDLLGLHSFSVECITLCGLYAGRLSTAPHATTPSDLFVRLTILEGDDEVPLAPNLRCLSLEIDDADTRSTDHICDIVGSRAGMGRKHPLSLQEVEVKFSDSRRGYNERACQSLRSGLAPFVASGLRMKIGTE